jgi:hypothetical protein
LLIWLSASVYASAGEPALIERSATAAEPFPAHQARALRPLLPADPCPQGQRADAGHVSGRGSQNLPRPV